MAQKSTQKQSQQKNPRYGQRNLPFHSPSFTKSEKSELAERVAKGDIGLVHLNEVLSHTDWLKVRYDNDNGVWLVICTYTPPGEDEPSGLLTYRAKKLENALAMAIWKANDIDTSHFEPDDDDDF